MKVEVLGNWIGTHDIRFQDSITGTTIFTVTLDKENMKDLIDKLLGALYPEGANEEVEL